MADTLKTRCAKYAWNLRHGTCPKATDITTRKQNAHFRKGTKRQMKLITVVRKLLGAAGIPRINHGYYYAYASTLDRYTRLQLDRESQALLALDLADTWTARGLSRPVLDAIRAEIFDD